MEVFGDIVLSSKIDYAPNISYAIDGGMEISVFKLTDTTLVNEVVALDLTITLAAETATATDVPALHVFKELEDNTFDSGPNDELGVDDAGGVTYFAEDYCSPSYCREGGVEISVGKNISDTATSTELLVPVMTFNRSFAHTASATESILTTIGYNISESDQVTVTEVFTHEIFIPLDVSDSVSVDGSVSINKDIEAEYISDNATHSSLSVINIDKALVENQTATDAPVINLDTLFSDSGTISDSGVITIQDYADPTYFSEDYVGAGYNF